MNYHKIYTDLINRCKDKKYNEYTETHHIIPKCIGGTDCKDNLVIMSSREHYIAHILLYKIYKTNKLLYAINMMTIHNSTNRMTNRKYEWIRKKFVENHPCKQQFIKEKISKSLKDYYESKEYLNIKNERYWKYREIRICACGCGQSFECYKREKKKYIKSSHAPTNYDKVSETLKKTLSNLSENDMKERIKNSFGSCNQIERGKKISLSKKGKKTNQQEIMGKKYAQMNEYEFDIFISDKKQNIKKRMINLRQLYL